MKKICIFLFSGTGMTKYVIDRMKKEFEGRQVIADVFLIEKSIAEDFSYEEYDAIGVAYPVHSFNAPEIVVKFARRLPRADNMSAFIISSAGGDSSLNFDSSKLLKKTLEKKGFSVFYDRQFIMPSNFIVKDSGAEVKEKINKVNIEAPAAVDEIINRVPHKMKSKFNSKIIAFLGRIEWYGIKYWRFFYADGNCDGCGLCAGKCPNGRIVIEENRAVFKKKCGLCMRCLYLCPKKAIKTRRLFKSFGFENWYEDLPHESAGK